MAAEALVPGSRVELQALVSRPELNGLPGSVAGPLANGRHKVALDQGGKLINAKPGNLRRRQPPPSKGPLADRAAVLDGHAREDEGRLFHLTLDLTRFYANERVHLCQLESYADLGGMRGSPAGMDVLRKLAGAAWTYWMPQPGHDFPGVRTRVIQCANYNIEARADAEAAGAASLPDEDEDVSSFPVSVKAQELMLEEMQRGDAAHWGDSTRRITGSFIAVEQREEGTVMLRHATPEMTNAAGAIVPAREAELYLVAGIAEGIGQMLARQAGLALPAGPLELTLLPYRGRYFYDGLVAGRIGGIQDSLVDTLMAEVRALEDRGELRTTPPAPTEEQLARLLQNERRARFQAATDEDDEPAEPLNEETNRLLRAFAQLPVIPDPGEEQRAMGLDRRMWVMRRMGYTQQENPHNALLIMSAGGDGPIGGPATTNALDPTSEELLRILAERAQAFGQRPSKICTDCADAVKGMKAALSSVDGTRVEYYAPPSEEERSAARTGHAHIAAMNT